MCTIVLFLKKKRDSHLKWSVKKVLYFVRGSDDGDILVLPLWLIKQMNCQEKRDPSDVMDQSFCLIMDGKQIFCNLLIFCLKDLADEWLKGLEVFPYSTYYLI